MYTLKQLRGGTNFTYNGKEYSIGGSTWNSEGKAHTDKDATYMGLQSTESVPLVLCHPKLGGVFQTNIKLWFNQLTEVIVY